MQRKKPISIFLGITLAIVSILKVDAATHPPQPDLQPYTPQGEEYSGERYITTDTVTTDTVSFRVDFKVGKSVIDPAYNDNAKVLAELKDFLEDLKGDSTRSITKMSLCGSVSPEGPRLLNERLAVNRANALAAHIPSSIEIGVKTDTSHLLSNKWDADALAVSNKIPISKVYSSLRFASVDFIIDTMLRKQIALPMPELVEMPEETPPTMQLEKVEEVIEEVATVQLVPEYITESWHLKTNLLGWGLMAANLAIEGDLSQRWSLSLPFYYSAMNYFTSLLKFRTLTFQPEVRYWLNGNSDTKNRWFIGAHFGMGWFNYALHDKYRIQDTGWKHPALGGGISAGYRISLPWGKGNHWKMEFTLGVGAYDAKYDKWLIGNNQPLYQGELRKTFIGVDNAAVTFIYSFNKKLQKK